MHDQGSQARLDPRRYAFEGACYRIPIRLVNAESNTPETLNRHGPMEGAGAGAEDDGVDGNTAATRRKHANRR